MLPGATDGSPAALDDSDVTAFLHEVEPAGPPALDDSDVSRFLGDDPDAESHLQLDVPSSLGSSAEPSGTMQVGVVRDRRPDEQDAVDFEARLRAAELARQEAAASSDTGYTAAYYATPPVPDDAERETLEDVGANEVGAVDDLVEAHPDAAEVLASERLLETTDVEAVDAEAVDGEDATVDDEQEAAVDEEEGAAVVELQRSDDAAEDGDPVDAAVDEAYRAATIESVDEDILASSSASWEAVSNEAAELPAHEVRRRRETPFGIETAPPNITPLELEGGLPEGEFHWLNQFDLFRAEVQRLARAKRWRRVAAVTAHAVLYAPYSTGGTRTGMLLDLARIYRDRLKDAERAQEAFAAVADIEPENAEALAYLVSRFEEAGAHRALYDLYYAAVESTWDPQDRLLWTEACASLALESLDDISLATRAWEQLWRLGDAEAESARELARFYRLSKDWVSLASFLRTRAEQATGADRTLLLRELAEVLRFGTDDGHAAAEVLESLRRDAPGDPVVIHQLCDLYADLQRWERLAALAPPESRDVERLRLVGDTLWNAGRREQAARVAQQLLDAAPGEETARERVESWLRESAQFDALVDALVRRAGATRSDDERIELWSEAAQIADRQLGRSEQAIELLQRRIEVEGPTEPTLRQLAALHRRRGDAGPLVDALDACLEQVTDGEARVELLRELAQRAQSDLRDADRAEAAWEELLTLRPADDEAYTALVEIHRERGAHDQLVTTLERQIERTTDRAAGVRLRRAAAEYLDRHFDDPARAVRAWERVLNDAPDDDDALAAIARHAAAAQDTRSHVLALERRIRISSSIESRVAWSIEVAELRERAGDLSRAAAAFERVLHWEPQHEGALNGMVRVLTGAERADLAVDVLDHAASAEPGADRRASLIRRTLALLPESASAERFERLRRIRSLTGANAVLDELEGAASTADRWTSYAAVLEQAVSDASGPEREALIDRLCATYEAHLGAAERAYLLRQARLIATTPSAETLDELARLAEATGRFEDHAALLDRASVSDVDADLRRARLSERATLLQLHCDDPMRAIEAWRRVLAVSPEDEDARAAIRELAEEHDLWEEWAYVVIAQADAAHGDEHRLTVAAELGALATDAQDDASRRLAAAFRAFRIRATDDAHRERLSASATEHDAWQWVLPAFEGWSLAQLPDDEGAALRGAATLAREHVEDANHAFELVALSLDAAPDDAELVDALGELAEQTGRCREWAQSLQRAAARSEDEERQIALLRRAAEVFEGPLEEPAGALDVHRRVLELDPTAVRSLDVVIDHLRAAERASELRARLRESLELDLDATVRRERMLEAAALSEGPLDDVPTALHLYGRVLEEHPDDAAARARMEALVSRLDDPTMRLEFLDIERESVSAARRAELELEMAQLQLERLDDLDGALATLSASVEAGGSESAAFGPLVDLLRRHSRWMPLADLLVRHAEQTSDADARLALLRDALDALERSEDATSEAVAEVHAAVLALDPEDRTARRALAQHYRANGLHEELLDALTALAESARSDDERNALDRERARLLHRNLDRVDDAAAIWGRLLDEGAATRVAHAALATMAWEREDIDAFLEHRRALALEAPPEHGALILCHLAEACDEVGDRYDTMVELYREARRMHAACTPAMEALKGIGRRRRDLRPEAALLPEPGERDLTWRERATRLHEQASAQLEVDPDAALELLRRAVSVDPDRVAGWDALAELLDRLGEGAAAYDARLEALEALRRSTALNPDVIDAEAERLLALAQESRADGDDETFDRLVRRVHELAPTHVPTALVVARRERDRGEAAEAFSLLDGLLTRHAARVPFDLLPPLLHERAASRLALDDVEGARRDLQAALIHDPIDADALELLAGIYAGDARYVDAVPHQIRAIAVEADGTVRARRYLDLGVLWEDGLQQAREAGACFVAARNEGLESRALLHRMFRHHQRTGELEQGLDVVDTLLEGASEPEELATLWVARGEIFAAHEGREDDAIEAFDMALSYDPECDAARLALADVLEQRADWDAALQILQGIAETCDGAERAAAFTRAARIAREELGDTTRAEAWLHDAVNAHPTADAVSSLASVVGARAAGSDEHLALLGRLARLGPPWYAPAMQLGTAVLDQHAEWAWCLLSPALVIRDSDDDLKSQLRAMRRDFERPPIRVAPSEAWPLADDLEPLRAVLAEVEEHVLLGRASAADVAADASEISMHSNVGRTFATLAEAMSIEATGLYRAEELDEPVVVAVDDRRAEVVVRADVFQQMARAEIGFVLTFALELCRPGVRGMAALPPDHRAPLVGGLFAACDFGEPVGVRATQFATRLRERVDAEQLDAWAEALEGLGDEDPMELGARYWRAVCDRALTLGLLAGPDLFQAVRLLARMDRAEERPTVFDSSDAFDAYIGHQVGVAHVLEAACSLEFARWLQEAETLD